MSRMIATMFGVGLLRPGPGTWGSAAALPLAWALHTLGGFPLLAAAIAAALGAGWAAANQELARTQDPDPDWIVIDEAAGQWIALLPVSFGAWFAGVPILALWPGWIAAFAAFRLLDIWKPGPVGWADRKGGAAGVMLDDAIAGALAAIAVALAGAAAHLFLIP
jgi:phosphatidylglycerophosphatase A